MPALRGICNISQDDLAKSIRVSRTRISLYECGKAPIKPQTYNKLVTYFSSIPDSSKIIRLQRIGVYPVGKEAERENSENSVENDEKPVGGD